MAESGKFIEPKQLLIKKCSCCQTSSEFGISSHSSCCRFFSIAGHFKVLSLSGNSSETCSTFRAVGIVCSVCFCPEQSCAYGTFLIFRIVFPYIYRNIGLNRNAFCWCCNASLNPSRPTRLSIYHRAMRVRHTPTSLPEPRLRIPARRKRDHVTPKGDLISFMAGAGGREMHL